MFTYKVLISFISIDTRWVYDNIKLATPSQG